MPELPEVEIVRLGLASLLPERQVVKVEHNWPKSFPNAAADVKSHLIGASVRAVRRRGKVLIIDLDSGYSLVIHLKMTGQLVFRSSVSRFGAGHPSDSLVGKLPDKSTRVSLNFKDNSQLFFNDQRKFGWVKLMPTLEVDNLDFFRRIGPEPLSADFTWRDLKKRLQRRQRTTIKAALLDQTVIAGVGNIYADESLWGSQLHPARLVGSLSDADYRRLHREIRFVLKLAIEKGGSTDRNYVNAEGKKGSYLGFARVFRRQGQTCPRCGHIIQKIRVAGRGTHFCPHCQKLP